MFATPYEQAQSLSSFGVCLFCLAVGMLLLCPLTAW
jgi:hypothetical protein